MNVKRLYDYRGFEGGDVSIGISLFEYGLIWKKMNKDEYKFIFGVDHNGEIYTKFDYSFLTKDDFINMMNSSWFDLDKVLDFIGTQETKEEFLDSWFYHVSDCISYYGTENILGESYYSFEIKGEY